MLKRITVVGLGSRIQGQSDKGPFDFRNVSFVFEDDHCAPFRTGHCTLPWVASESLKSNTNYWVDLKFVKYNPVITAVYREDV